LSRALPGRRGLIRIVARTKRLQLTWEGRTFSREPIPAWKFRHLPAEPARLATPPQQIEAVASTVSPAESADTEPLAAVMQMASSLSSEDLRSVVSAAGEETLLVEDLSPAERAAFVRLLHAEMEKVQ